MAVESSLLWNEIGLGKNPSSALTGPVTLHKLLNLFKQDPDFPHVDDGANDAVFRGLVIFSSQFLAQNRYSKKSALQLFFSFS